MSIVLQNAIRRIRAQGITGAASAYWQMFRWSRARKNPARRYLIRRVQGSKMYLDLRRPGISEDLNKYGFREGEQLHLVRKTLRPGMCVFDIGGNIGYYTCLAARIVGEKGKVYAVEPDPENCALLRKNIELNGYESFVEIEELAISDQNGEQKFNLANVSNRHSFHNLTDDPGDEHTADQDGRSISVQMRDLPTFLGDRRRPDYLRMDVEGHEVEVLRNLAEVSASLDWRPDVMFEVHDWYYNMKSHDIRRPLTKLFDLGYEPQWLVSTSEPAREFRRLGYEPSETIRPVETAHGFYENVRPEHALDLIAAPRQTKAVFLSAARRKSAATG
ncbi:MAG: FkbM family methyltransferase [Limisphaerales bacterium]|jgi:FkbM family methyltransferase